MHLSVLLPSFGVDFATSLQAAVELGFTHVDVVATASRTADELNALADSGLIVSCAALGKGMPEGQTLDAGPLAERRAALDTAKRQLDDAALLGATTGYLVPGLGKQPDDLRRFTDACQFLADHAAGRMIRLCVEHVPGRALAEVRQVLQWLRETKHANLYLLLDIGHCLITKESAADAVREAGPHLGHVHFDDNDGVKDLHLPLFAGKLQPSDLHAAMMALRSSKYAGGLSLELNPENPEPREGVRAGKEILERLVREGTK
jgi:sugar phosphate isomerase/epimerase